VSVIRPLVAEPILGLGAAAEDVHSGELAPNDGIDDAADLVGAVAFDPRHTRSHHSLAYELGGLIRQWLVEITNMPAATARKFMLSPVPEPGIRAVRMGRYRARRWVRTPPAVARGSVAEAA
jgi:hypothetical protein